MIKVTVKVKINAKAKVKVKTKSKLKVRLSQGRGRDLGQDMVKLKVKCCRMVVNDPEFELYRPQNWGSGCRA